MLAAAVLLGVLATTPHATTASPDANAILPEPEEHVADPFNQLARAEKGAVETLLEGIRADTKVDVRALLTNDDAREFGATAQAAYDRLEAARNSEAAVLLAFSREGEARLFVSSGRSPIDSDTAASVESTASNLARSGKIGLALRSASATLGVAIRAQAVRPFVRPSGTPDWSGSGAYATGALVTVIAAVASWRRRSQR
jgi:hypothetical protein